MGKPGPGPSLGKSSLTSPLKDTECLEQSWLLPAVSLPPSLSLAGQSHWLCPECTKWFALFPTGQTVPALAWLSTRATPAPPASLPPPCSSLRHSWGVYFRHSALCEVRAGQLLWSLEGIRPHGFIWEPCQAMPSGPAPPSPGWKGAEICGDCQS